jgi:hypothetical protein
MDYADSDATPTFARQSGDAKMLYKMNTYGKANATCRFEEWNREFQMMLAKSPDGSAVPALMMIRLPNDHTTGAKPGAHTPKAYVADNDYGLGEIVAAVSRSPIWKNTAIFVIEDDAQSGADHVDAHRTIGFVISPWITAHSVDHRFYNTDSVLKTMELILGLDPLSQYDAVADPIMDWDRAPANDAAYDAIAPPAALFSELNPEPADLSAADPRREMAVKSEGMDFAHPDAAPALELDRIVWQTVKGPHSAMPMMRRTLPMGAAGGDDDDGK